MDNYTEDKDDLHRRYIAMITEPNAFKESEGVFTTDWVLKLLKSRGCSLLVEKGLKTRTQHVVIKTLFDTSHP